ncbi:hypothetical protein FKM82_024136 [Ascaphus truei]
MDPLEVGQALSSIYEHFQYLDNQIASLTQNLATVSLNQSQPRNIRPSTLSVSSPEASLSLEPCLPTPSRYAGDPHGCRGFLNQCDIQFELTPSRFSSDRSKVAYIITLLTGDALAWASPIWEQKPELIQDFPRFKKEFKQVFDTPGRNITAASFSFSHFSGSQTGCKIRSGFSDHRGRDGLER